MNLSMSLCLAQNNSGNTTAAIFIAPLLIILLIGLALSILVVVSQWIVFDKAGQPGWAAIIPIFNTIIMLKVAGKPIWWIILFFVPFVNVIVAIIMVHGISTNFGRSVGTTLGLMFLPIIFWPILAFGSAEYNPVDSF